MKKRFPVPPLRVGFLKLRTAGLSSAKAATFGMVRRNPDGSPRAHQGTDLAVDNGYRCYAVDDGIVTPLRPPGLSFFRNIPRCHGSFCGRFP